ncbi:MAG: threonylcarbamoyl-AMP synthase [Anaerolineales bacterium]|nr:threonylcarbamoyl-AMP synthase [Anaerolineales bacterium]
MTIVIKVDPNQPEPDSINRAAEVIKRGGLVAFPTETVYGLGANALDESAVRRIFEVKDRPEFDPLIIHLAGIEQLESVAIDVSDLTRKLAKLFWPGPLTLIQWKRNEVPSMVTSGLPTLAARVPAHPVALALLKASGVPIAAPSANLFGRASPTTSRHVLNDLGSRIEMLLDGGPTTIGVESTVLDITTHPPTLLRPGGVPLEALEEVIGAIIVQEHSIPAGVSLRSPGMLSKHYAPRAELVLCTGKSPHEALRKMRHLVEKYLDQGLRVGLLLVEEDCSRFEELDVVIYPLGQEMILETIAYSLYAGLRALDDQDVDIILTRDFGDAGLGLAIRDRLKRAASRVV